jgi:hypothetical protein
MGYSPDATDSDCATKAGQHEPSTGLTTPRTATSSAATSAGTTNDGTTWTKSPAAPFLHAKQEVTVAIGLFNWLTCHGISLPEVTQAHLNVWQAEGPTTRRIAERFLKWAIKTKAAPSGLTIVPHRRGTSQRLAKPGGGFKWCLQHRI